MTMQPPFSLDPPTSFSEDAYSVLQESLVQQFRDVFPDKLASRTILVIPSLSLDPEELAKISGVHHYEERMLCLLMLLRWPRTRLIYVTSQPIHPSIIDYYLHLLPGVPESHARKRLTLLSCHDGSTQSLTQKILNRPRLMRRIKELVHQCKPAHMTCFNATNLEKQLSVKLDIPLYAADPALAHWGSKSGSRAVFREAGISMPDGAENLHDVEELARAMVQLRTADPDLKRVVVKLNEGFSGEGNALFSFEGMPDGPPTVEWMKEELPKRLDFEAETETWEGFIRKLAFMGGIVECFVEGTVKRSPSAQCRINPLGEVCIISTHDQLLGGPNGQVFQGCTFPADEAYRLEIQEAGLKVANILREKGVIGRFGIDFISVLEHGAWQHYAIEINLRKGGTTHPFLMLQFLIDGSYDTLTGSYLTPTGQERYYVASDNLQAERYCGIMPDDLIDISVYHGLHFHGTVQEGIVFHLIGALSEFGKLGVVSIGKSPARAQQFYDDFVAVLEKEATAQAHERLALSSDVDAPHTQPAFA